MGGRQFNAPNKAVPACVERMAAKPPACFTQPTWRLYLLDCYRGTLNDAAARARLNRDELPPYCEDCSREHAETMRAQMRCRPPVGALTPFNPEPVEDPEPQAELF
jgi:hypothetical protein